MQYNDVNVDWYTWETRVDLIIYREDGSTAVDISFTLDKLEEFQGRLAIAAAKLRGKLAKEATSQ